MNKIAKILIALVLLGASTISKSEAKTSGKKCKKVLSKLNKNKLDLSETDSQLLIKANSCIDKRFAAIERKRGKVSQRRIARLEELEFIVLDELSRRVSETQNRDESLNIGCDGINTINFIGDFNGDGQNESNSIASECRGNIILH